MHYLIDGYNLLFRILESKKSLQTQRELIVHSLQKEFKSLHLKGTIVFDGRHRRDEESGLTYRSPLVVAYSHQGQTADQYILEKLENAPVSETCVVTDDRFLANASHGLGANTLHINAFLRLVEKKRTAQQQKQDSFREERPMKESKKETERLIKIFEDRLHHPSDSDR